MLNNYAGHIWAPRLTKALAAIPGTLKAQSKDMSTADKVICTNQILQAVKGSGIQLTAEEAKKIIDEVLAHPKELLDVITDLVEAFGKESASAVN